MPTMPQSAPTTIGQFGMRRASRPRFVRIHPVNMPAITKTMPTPNGASRLTGSSLRRGVSVNYDLLVRKLTAHVAEQSASKLLRVYWYDAAPNATPDAEQQFIAGLPHVKLRLGRVGMEGEQKGVDLRIGLDMVGHSRNRAVESIYLVSGDDDLTEAVEEAQAQGVLVTVLAVPNESGTAHGVSRHLARAADEVLVLDDALLDEAVHRLTPVPAPVPITESAPQPPAEPTRPASPPVPGPPNGARPVPVPRAPGSAPVPSSTLVASTSSARPTTLVASESTVAEIDPDTIERVVANAYASWRASASEAQRDALPARRPTIPADLDRALLVDLSGALGEYTLDESARVALRAHFWAFVDRGDA